MPQRRATRHSGRQYGQSQELGVTGCRRSGHSHLDGQCRGRRAGAGSHIGGVSEPDRSESADSCEPAVRYYGVNGHPCRAPEFQQCFFSLSVTPNDPTLQANALTAAGTVASAFNQTASSLDKLGNSLNSQIQSTATQINPVSSQVAALNRQAAAGGANPATSAGLRSALDQLSPSSIWT